nr:flagellar assembly protein FliW [Paenibacillus sp. ACRRY]
MECDENQIYQFDQEIPGIPDVKRYGLFPLEDTPFYILHGLEEEVSFVLLPAQPTMPDYSFELPDEVTYLLEITEPGDLGIMLVVNIVNDELFVNMAAPILLSPDALKGCQYIIKDQQLPIRYRLHPKEDK